MSERIPGISPATVILFPLAAFALIGLFSISQSYGEHERAVARIDREMLAERQSMRLLDAEWAYLTRPQRLEQLMAARETGEFEPMVADAMHRQAEQNVDAKAAQPAEDAALNIAKKDDQAIETKTEIASVKVKDEVTEKVAEAKAGDAVTQTVKADPVPEVIAAPVKVEPVKLAEDAPAPVNAQPKAKAQKPAPAIQKNARVETPVKTAKVEHAKVEHAKVEDDVYRPAPKARAVAPVAAVPARPVAIMPVAAMPVAAMPVSASRPLVQPVAQPVRSNSPVRASSSAVRAERTSVSPRAGVARPVMEVSARSTPRGIARPIVE